MYDIQLQVNIHDIAFLFVENDGIFYRHSKYPKQKKTITGFSCSYMSPIFLDFLTWNLNIVAKGVGWYKIDMYEQVELL